VIDHISINVSDVATSRAFYEQALKPLGYEVIADFGKVIGFGAGGKPDFWIGDRARPTTPIHIAIASVDRETVDAFYEAALAAGGKDNGPPGLRVHYHPNYYGAFVRDPDGNNVEAVCHTPA
jgi:catechol 2,3-dioxygenase-like lactoylglutathione lyase family enzyme